MYFKALQENNHQHRLFCPAKLSFIIEGKLKSYQDKQKLQELMNTKLALGKKKHLKKSYTPKKKVNTTMKIQGRINLTK
jgi:hypothetical protein